ncbi:phosphopantetheine-binding protein [Myceligenerans xiligouense]|uniref:Phosphopantetheine binding protein n=1 Tax=Myceligenerans xiligouense TaxID=253184 RepID=A0A3N4ZR74_9MICO|nr:phosphopantetheine-binding protein [Myceligenerans xiligouense]RPF22271.1 phosphopantetheine binding protein [Myceligenerans xiligouense]
MNETAFKEALATFATEPAENLSMTDELDEIGIDSISVFELMIKLEDVVGEHATKIDDDMSTVQDLYDHVRKAAELHASA